MRLEYQSYKEAVEKFKWSERWGVFDKKRENLNIAYECVDRHPREKTAIRLKNSNGISEFYTFGELSDMTSKFANMLERRGVNQEDRVAIALHPSIEYYVSFFGTLKRGAVAVPCYAFLGPDGLEYRFKESKAKLAVISKQRIDIVPPGIVDHLIPSGELLEMIEDESKNYETDTSDETLAVIQFSSGTTGQPKQVLYRHAAMSVTAVMVKFWIGLLDDDRYICTSSPAWGHGIWYGTVGPLIFGNGIGAFSGKFDVVLFMEALEEFKITVMSAIPRVYYMIKETDKLEDYNLKFRRLTYSGAAMDVEVARYFKDKLDLNIGSAYGNTEAGPVVVDYGFSDWEARIGSAGKPMFGVKLGILDDKGNKVLPGVNGEVAVWRKDKWRLIGDSGHLDEDGYFWPQGRSDDVIKYSGYRIGPFEIETVLEKHPAVDLAAVVGSPDKELGEIVKAFVILKSGFKPSDDLTSEIQEYVKQKLSFHEYPKEIEYVDEIEQTPDGKLKRKVLKKKEYEKKGLKLP